MAFEVIWLQAAGCGGCTMSALAAEDVGLEPVLARFGIRLAWHPALSEESGAEAVAVLADAAAGRRRLDARTGGTGARASSCWRPVA